MKIIYKISFIKFLCIYFLSTFYIFSQNSNKTIIKEIINPVISSLIQEYNIPMVQVLIFSPDKKIVEQFRYDIQNKSVEIEEKSNLYYKFFVGELSYPLVNYIIDNNKNTLLENIKYLIKKDKYLEQIYIHLQNNKNYRILKYNLEKKNYENINLRPEELILDCLKNMLCGFEISKYGIFSINDTNSNEVPEISIVEEPFQHFFLSNLNYYYLQELLRLTFVNELDWIHNYLKLYQLKSSMFYKGLVDDNILNTNYIARGSYSDKKVSYIPHLIIELPFSYGFITNVEDYYKILEILKKNNRIFREYYTIEKNTSGYYNGFFYRKSCNSKNIIAEAFGFFPGNRSYVYVMDNGYGFIIFQSSDNDFVINFIRDKIEELLYRTLSLNCEKEILKNSESIEGYFRPINVSKHSLFSDIWIRKNFEEKLEVSNFFNKDPVGYIYKNKNGELFFYGNTRLNRYPLNFAKDNKSFTISIYEYKKIYWYQSIRGWIIIFAFIILILMLGILKYILHMYNKK